MTRPLRKALASAALLASASAAGGAVAGAAGAAFATFAAVSLGGALLCLAARGVARAALALWASLLGTAGLLVLLGSDFAALAQVAVQSAVLLAAYLVGTAAAPEAEAEPEIWRRGPALALWLALAAGSVGLLAWRTGGAFVAPRAGAASDGGTPAAARTAAALLDPARDLVLFALLAALAGVACALAADALARRSLEER